MTAESFDMADRLGIDGGGHNGKQDAFRHAYISAKVTRDEDTLYARAMGTGNEWKTEIEERIKTKLTQGNPAGEWEMDEHNNKIGRIIGRKAQEEGWGDERLAVEINTALEAGKMVEKPRPDEDISPENITPTQHDVKKPSVPANPSIMDYYVTPKQPEPEPVPQNGEEPSLWERLFGR